MQACTCCRFYYKKGTLSLEDSLLFSKWKQARSIRASCAPRPAAAPRAPVAAQVLPGPPGSGRGPPQPAPPTWRPDAPSRRLSEAPLVHGTVTGPLRVFCAAHPSPCLYFSDSLKLQLLSLFYPSPLFYFFRRTRCLLTYFVLCALVINTRT